MKYYAYNETFHGFDDSKYHSDCLTSTDLKDVQEYVDMRNYQLGGHYIILNEEEYEMKKIEIQNRKNKEKIKAVWPRDLYI